MSLLVGFSPHQDDHAALDLACQAGLTFRQPVDAVTVVPQGWPTPVAGHTDREFERWASEEGEASVAEATSLLARHADVETAASWRSGRSVPQVLLDSARADSAFAIVVGSGPSGPNGVITITSKSDRLLHSSPVPVLLAPRGYRAAPGAPFTRVTIGFRDDGTSWSLLRRAAPIARAFGLSLRIVTFAVRGRQMFPPPISGAEDMVLQQWREGAEAEQAKAIEHLTERGLPCEAISRAIATGRTWANAFDELDWDSGDLLVVGSSTSSDRLASVFLGSSASKIVRNSPVPVAVVPRTFWSANATDRRPR